MVWSASPKRNGSRVDYFPLFLNLKQKTCLVVGGGEVATRKTQALVRAQAKVVVVAPDIDSELENLLADYAGEYVKRDFNETDVIGKQLVIAATNSDLVNKAVAAAANKHNVLVNVVDNPELCTAITPAIVDRDPILIAISSGGNAPILVRQLRAKIETWVPSTYGSLASLAGRLRDSVKAVFSSGKERRYFWEHVLEGLPGEKALAGDLAGAEQLIQEQLQNPQQLHSHGEVYLVGAGPGDPDLLTFKALRLMQRADIVLYDRLVSQPIMDLVRRDAEKLYVGKQRKEHTLQQHQINELLVNYAKQGKRVLRLKGGDPFIFGRGGEEIQTLAEQGIPFQVVPGITAASGCASYAGIPLTHRDHAQSVRFITGHLQSDESNLYFPELLDPKQTLVFYMGLVGLPEICNKLIQHGRDQNTPAALIEKGTTPEQRVFIGTITSLPGLIQKQEVHAPTLLIIGDVVNLHDKLKWFGAD